MRGDWDVLTPVSQFHSRPGPSFPSGETGSRHQIRPVYLTIDPKDFTLLPSSVWGQEWAWGQGPWEMGQQFMVEVFPFSSSVDLELPRAPEASLPTPSLPS